MTVYLDRLISWVSPVGHDSTFQHTPPPLPCTITTDVLKDCLKINEKIMITSQTENITNKRLSWLHNLNKSACSFVIQKQPF